MSVNAGKSRVLYKADGRTLTFSFPFKVWTENEVAVHISENGKDVDVSGQVFVELLDCGGSITFAKAPADGAAIAILRRMPFSQEDEYSNGSRFDPSLVETRFDRDCAERQQLREALDRAIKLPPTSSEKPEEYQNRYFEEVEARKNSALAEMGAVATDAREAMANALNLAQTDREQAQQASAAANAALEKMRAVLASDFANAVRQAINAADAAKGFAADVEGAVIEAAEKAAACIVARMESLARQTAANAAAAAQSSCSAAANGEKTWLMVREMTAKAGEEAAACVLSRTTLNAKMAGASASAASASAATAAGLARSMAAIIHAKALEAAELAAGEVADCLANICESSAEISIRNADSAAASAKACAESANSMRLVIKNAAREAAEAAAEKVAECCQEICNECVQMALAHARAAASGAKAALGYAEMAKQTDICLEAETRRTKDEELEQRLDALAEVSASAALEKAERAMELAEGNRASIAEAEKDIAEASQFMVARLAEAGEAIAAANAAIDSLEQRNAASEMVIAENRKGLQSLESHTDDLAGEMEAQAQNLENIREAIAQNSAAIAGNARALMALDSRHSSLMDEVGAQKTQLAEVLQLCGANGSSIADNTKAITANKAAIEINSEGIEANTAAISANSREIDVAKAQADKGVADAAAAQNTANTVKALCVDMKGATTTAAGVHGLVPAPAAGSQAKYLRGDGTWQTPPDTNTTYDAATQSTPGLMSTDDKKKLDGIATGAQVNPGVATQSANGLMTAADKKKLDGIATGATNTAAPPAAATVAPKAHGTAAVGTSAKYAREDHVHPSDNTDTKYNPATQSANGLMTAADKKKLDGLNDSNLVHKTGDESIAGAKTFTGKILSAFSGNGDRILLTNTGYNQGKGAKPSTDQNTYISFFSNDGSNHWMGNVLATHAPDGRAEMNMSAMGTNTAGTVLSNRISVCVNRANGRKYGWLDGGTPSDSTSNEIATAAFVRSVLAGTASVSTLSLNTAPTVSKTVSFDSIEAQEALNSSIVTMSLDSELDYPEGNGWTIAAGQDLDELLERQLIRVERPLTEAEKFERLRTERNIRLLAYDSATSRLGRQLRQTENENEQKNINVLLAAWDAYAEELCALPDQSGAPWDGGGEKTPWPMPPQC